MNDLPDARCSPTEIYADDTLLHLIIPKNDHTALATLQANVTNAACWANSWRGRFCPRKTVLLPIGKTAREACLENNVIMENEVINVAVSHKHCGFTISTDLRWTAHIKHQRKSKPPRRPTSPGIFLFTSPKNCIFLMYDFHHSRASPVPRTHSSQCCETTTTC